jgi:hypothetical protein
MLSNRPETPAGAGSTAQGDPKRVRRSSRVTIEIPVEIICKGPHNSVHTEETRTLVVSAHGCGLLLNTPTVPGDKLVLIHKRSREEMVCRIVMCDKWKTGGWHTGVEFQSPSPKFWHIAFPPDWEPSIRKHPVAAK